MKFKNVTAILVLILLLGIFNVSYFLFFGSNALNQPIANWISYGFINFALLTLLIPICFSESDSRLETLNNSLYLITSIFIVVEIIVGIICILLKLSDYRIPLLIQAILLAIYFVLIVLNLRANKITRNAIKRQDKELLYVKEAATKLSLVIDIVSDKNIRSELEKAYDVIHSSPTRSDKSVEALEKEIMDIIEKVHFDIMNNTYSSVVNDANNILRMANQRNKMLQHLYK